jgi:hypothetical protein
MTLGCGSWGGNVTSDNVSPIHLMDVKRVAFETKAVSSQQSAVSNQSPIKNYQSQGEGQKPKRAEIAAIVDKFLSQKLSETPKETVNSELRETIKNPKPEIQNDISSPVKTIIHELKPTSEKNGAKPAAVDFVSEADVRSAFENGEKIYITPKTILTPAARDLGDEKEIFALIK